MAYFIESERINRFTKTELKHWSDVHRPSKKSSVQGFILALDAKKKLHATKEINFLHKTMHNICHTAPPVRWKLLVKTENQ